jgi:uncharacterized circularly permuted ATP-grasp superfamily protein
MPGGVARVALQEGALIVNASQTGCQGHLGAALSAAAR